MAQITKADFPKSWQAGKAGRPHTSSQHAHDARQYWKRFMLRLDDPASERLDELATYFGVPHAEVICQLIVQAKLNHFPLAVEEQPQAMHAARRPT